MWRALPTGFLQMLRKKIGRAVGRRKSLSGTGTHMIFSQAVCSPRPSRPGSKSLATEVDVRAATLSTYGLPGSGGSRICLKI